MMRPGIHIKIFILGVASLLTISKGFAQETEYRIDSAAVAKLLVHFDKSDYFAGDTLFFKIYVYADYALNLISKNIYVGLYTDSGKMIASKRFPVMGGVCSGDIELADTLAHGRYYFQAFTPQQLNAGDSLVAIKPVFIVNPNNIPGRFREPGPPVYTFQIFPQGGNLVEGISNKIAFKTMDQYGNPVSMEGKLIDETNEAVLEFSSEQGIGSFYFMPESKRYTAVISFPGGSIQKYLLPDVLKSGIILTVSDNNSNKEFLIESHPAVPKDEKNLLLLGVMNTRLIFRQPISFNQHVSSGKIPASKLPSGILYMAVADEKGRIVTTATTFINNREYLKTVNLKTDSLDFGPGGSNVFTISFPDTVIASLSVSVTDKKYSGFFNPSTNNIIPDALLHSESRSFAAFPVSLMMDTSLKAKNLLALLMQTGGWLAPDWKALIGGEEEVPGKLHDTAYINISGKVYKENTTKLLSGGSLNFMISTKDSTRSFAQVPVEKDGSFVLRNMIYEDSASFSYMMNKGKGGAVTVVLDPPGNMNSNLLFRGPSFNEFENDKMVMRDDLKKEGMNRIFSLLNDSSGKYKVLQEITVTTKKRNPTMLVNQRYATGLFSNVTTARVLDFINDPPTSGATNIFDYLQGRLAGVMITRKGGQYVVESFRGLSISNMTMGGNGLIDGKIFLNEFEVTSDEVVFIPLSKIALVKYFPPGTILLPNVGTAPVLAIYTKEGEDLSSYGRTFLQRFIYPGYSRSHLDYDYESGSSSGYSGIRGTLLWQPDLFLNGESKELKIRFTNWTGAKEIRIVIQGVTSDGEFIYLEKTISREGGGKGF